MLEVFAKYLCFTMLTITGAYVVKLIIKDKVKIFKRDNIFVILLLQIIPTILHNTDYSSLNTFIILCINITIYKKIFKKSILETILLSLSAMIISFVADIFTFLSIMIFTNINAVRSVWYVLLLSNICSCIYSILIIKINFISKLLNKVIFQINNSKVLKNVIFIALTFVILCISAKNFYSSLVISKGLISSLIIALIFIVLTLIYLYEQYKYNKLTEEYDSMFNYVNEFEDWIEKEQFNRHEYKNQLAVLRCLSTEKKVKEKIDEILEDNIKLEGKIVHELKCLPKGGIKGLMYYKSAQAQKNKIDLTISASVELHSMLSKLSNDDIRTLCKLIGIYYDNAIEAAMETRKKIVLVEIYELKDKVSFVFSNTFKKHKNFDDRNKKGISSKGEGHGNGLYFANKLLEKNTWIESKQDVIDKYYIQQLIIHKK